MGLGKGLPRSEGTLTKFKNLLDMDDHDSILSWLLEVE